MPLQRFKKLPPERQAEILRAAADEFGERGYEAASYNQIIEKAGVSKGAMYYYFEDKLDLYVTVIEDVQARAMAEIGISPDWRPPEDFWGMLRQKSIASWRFALAHRELAALLRSMSAFPRKMKFEGRLGELFQVGRDMLRGLLETGQAQGVVRTDLPLELLVETSMVLDEAMDLYLLGRLDELAEEPAEEVVDTVLDLWQRLLAPREALAKLAAPPPSRRRTPARSKARAKTEEKTSKSRAARPRSKKR